MNKSKSFARINSTPLLARRCSREHRANASASPHLASASSVPILRRSRSGKVHVSSSRQARHRGRSPNASNKMNMPGPNAEFETTLAVIISNISSSKRTSLPATRKTPTASTRPTSSSDSTLAEPLPQQKPKQVPGHLEAKANIKYKNEAGRAAVLGVSKTVHHDFGQLNNICNVTLPIEELDVLAENPDIEWVDRSGAVFFMQPYRSSK